MNRSKRTRPGIMKMYARGASRSQKRALPRGCWTTSASALDSAVMTLMGCSGAVNSPGCVTENAWGALGYPVFEVAKCCGEGRLAPVNALQLGLSLLHGARRVTGLDRL